MRVNNVIIALVCVFPTGQQSCNMLGFFSSKNISYFPHLTFFFTHFIEVNSAFILKPEPSGTFLSGAAVFGRSAVDVGQIPVTLLRKRDRPGPVLPNPKILLTGAESQRPVFDSQRSGHVSASAPVCRPECCECDSSESRLREGKTS